jgi:hypothetical protein
MLKENTALFIGSIGSQTLVKLLVLFELHDEKKIHANKEKKYGFNNLIFMF